MSAAQSHNLSIVESLCPKPEAVYTRQITKVKDERVSFVRSSELAAWKSIVMPGYFLSERQRGVVLVDRAISLKTEASAGAPVAVLHHSLEKRFAASFYPGAPARKSIAAQRRQSKPSERI